ncbi:hypothetical protein GN956_G25879 [Arapaima gigas]
MSRFASHPRSNDSRGGSVVVEVMHYFYAGLVLEIFFFIKDLDLVGQVGGPRVADSRGGFNGGTQDHQQFKVASRDSQTPRTLGCRHLSRDRSFKLKGEDVFNTHKGRLS